MRPGRNDALTTSARKGYCRLSKLIRTRTLDETMLRSDVDNEVMALAIVRHGVYNVKTYGDVEHSLYKVALGLVVASAHCTC